MSHGLVALERDNRPGVGVWQFAMARGEFVAVYAPRQMEPPSLKLISIGNRWWYFPYFSDEIPFTIFLAPEMEMVSEVAERRSNVKGFEVLERW